MLSWLVHIVVDTIVLLIAARMLPKVELKGWKTALVVAILIGILSFFLSWILTAILNVVTLGIFYLLGLGFITRIFAFAIIIELADKLSKGFKTHGFMPSLWLAIIIAIVGTIVDWLIL
ncbi:phage holin family protein [Salinimicrobium sp. HB62]|uniref:phage holin family protein n=1 Tax=Salinimicrobium sp. HB62 TaxID=3077781 RepID=UPI002D774CC6|nr:phage holin family protein [Salinimicrobium sp. HB62]